MEENQATPMKTFNIDLFQTARVHTERIPVEAEDIEEAEKKAREIAKEKDIPADFDITEIVPEPSAIETLDEIDELIEEGEKTNKTEE